MSLTLKDLWVMGHTGSLGMVLEPIKPASLADLVEVLKQHGAAVHRPFYARMSYKGEPWRIDVPQDGRYLVLPLDETPK